MGLPIRKTYAVANDRLRPVAASAVALPVMLPLQHALPVTMPHVRYVRLAPVQNPRRDFSWAATFAVLLLAALIFMFGAIAGTVFWFTYDAENTAKPVSSSSVMARLMQKPALPGAPVKPQIEPIQEQPLPPEGILLPAEDPAPTAKDASAIIAADDGHVLVHEGEPLDIHVLLGTAREKLEFGENDVALTLYERVLVEEPENRAALEGKAYALSRSGRYAAAAAVSHNLLKFDPQDAVARANLASMLGASPSTASLTELQHMVAAKPDDAAIQAALAKAMALRGDVKGAIPHLDRAVRLAPEDVTARFDLAVLYDRAGQGPEALALYRQILQLAGDSDSLILPLETLTAIRRRADYLGISRIQD